MKVKREDFIAKNDVKLWKYYKSSVIKPFMLQERVVAPKVNPAVLMKTTKELTEEELCQRGAATNCY